MDKELGFILNEINDFLERKSLDKENIGILDGVSGIIIFKIFYNKYHLRKEEYPEIQDLFDLIITKINNGKFLKTYCSGLSGFCWTLCFFKKNKLIEIEDFLFDFLEIVDDILYTQMILDFNQGKFDVLHGALGYSKYFLIRYQIEEDPDRKKTYYRYLLETIEFLEKISIREEEKIKWTLPLSKDLNYNIYNFGLAHGIPSIINFLSNVLDCKIEIDRTKKLLEGGVKYILSNKIENGLSIFPVGIKETADYNINEDSSRLAWCYGDLGISFSIYNAGNSLKNDDIIMNADEIFKHTCYRTNLEENTIVDAPLCHGIFGLSLMYSKAFSYFKNSLYLGQSDYWMSKGIELFHLNGEGINNFYTINTLTENKKMDSGILEGLSGIGITIISKLYNIDSDWDSCLMLS